MARAILTDIEGTTSSIAFVRDVLFPYARRALPGFVAAHGGEPEVRRWLGAVPEETGAAGDGAMIATLQGWIGRIAGAIGRAPADILFLSDVVEELDAAREAGLATLPCSSIAAPTTGSRAPAPPPTTTSAPSRSPTSTPADSGRRVSGRPG